MKSWINNKLDDFSDKNEVNYLNMEIFKQIFYMLDNSELKENNPELYETEVKRIRDLNNSFVYAFEEDKKVRTKNN